MRKPIIITFVNDVPYNNHLSKWRTEAPFHYLNSSLIYILLLAVVFWHVLFCFVLTLPLDLVGKPYVEFFWTDPYTSKTKPLTSTEGTLILFKACDYHNFNSALKLIHFKACDYYDLNSLLQLKRKQCE